MSTKNTRDEKIQELRRQLEEAEAEADGHAPHRLRPQHPALWVNPQQRRFRGLGRGLVCKHAEHRRPTARHQRCQRAVGAQRFADGLCRGAGPA